MFQGWEHLRSTVLSTFERWNRVVTEPCVTSPDLTHSRKPLLALPPFRPTHITLASLLFFELAGKILQQCPCTGISLARYLWMLTLLFLLSVFSIAWSPYWKYCLLCHSHSLIPLTILFSSCQLSASKLIYNILVILIVCQSPPARYIPLPVLFIDVFQTLKAVPGIEWVFNKLMDVFTGSITSLHWKQVGQCANSSYSSVTVCE